MKAETSIETIENNFNQLEKSIQGISPKNILNFDETNFSDNPGSQRCLFCRKVKYPERIMNYSKWVISVMFAGTAEGQILPPYIVYKSTNLWGSWCRDGPKGMRFNRIKSGWFDASTFDDWFRTVVVPWARRLEGRKLVIGDNLSSHLNLDIVKLCSKNNIIMAFLSENINHLTQPLYVAYFRRLKGKWRKTLTDYKIAHP